MSELDSEGPMSRPDGSVINQAEEVFAPPSSSAPKDPLAGVPAALAERIREFLTKQAATVAEYHALDGEGQRLIGELPTRTEGKGRHRETKNVFPDANRCILNRLRELQNQRLILDTFG
jgi:hypothetical protein